MHPKYTVSLVHQQYAMVRPVRDYNALYIRSRASLYREDIIGTQLAVLYREVSLIQR